MPGCFAALLDRCSCLDVLRYILAPSTVLANPRAWDSLFRAGYFAETKDWLVHPNAVLDEIRAALRAAGAPGAARVLHAACGNSPLGVALLGRLPPGSVVVNADASSAAVEQMRALHPPTAALRWELADCRALPYAARAFDLVVDKGGIDAMIEGGDHDAARAALREYRRCAAGAYIVCISAAGRERLAREAGWSSVRLRELGDGDTGSLDLWMRIVYVLELS